MRNEAIVNLCVKLVCGIFLCSFPTGVSATLTKVPMNAAAVTGSLVTLECQSDVTTSAQIDWTFGTALVAKGCIALSGPYATIAGPTSCSLVIKDVANVSGQYSCQPAVEGGNYSAEVIQIVAEPEVLADNVKPIAGQTATVNCSLRFVPVPKFTPRINWSVVAGNALTSQRELANGCNVTSCVSTVSVSSPVSQTAAFHCIANFAPTQFLPNEATNNALYTGGLFAVVTWTSGQVDDQD